MTNLIIPGERYLAAFDPGEGIGWAVFGPKGEPLGLGNVYGRDDLYQLLEDIGPVAVVVIEDWRLFGKLAKQQAGSKMEAARVIGAIESWCAKFNVDATLQPSSILPIAEKWSGMKMTGPHSSSHHISAFNHAWYYLQKNNIIKPVRQPM